MQSLNVWRTPSGTNIFGEGPRGPDARRTGKKGPYELQKEGTPGINPVRADELEDLISLQPVEGPTRDIEPGQIGKVADLMKEHVRNWPIPKPVKRFTLDRVYELRLWGLVQSLRIFGRAPSSDKEAAIALRYPGEDPAKIRALIAESELSGIWPANVAVDEMVAAEAAREAELAEKRLAQSARMREMSRTVETTPGDERVAMLVVKKGVSTANAVVRQFFNEHTLEQFGTFPNGDRFRFVRTGKYALFHKHGKVELGDPNVWLAPSDTKVTHLTRAQIDAMKNGPLPDMRCEWLFEEHIARERADLPGRRDAVKREVTVTDSQDAGRSRIAAGRAAMAPFKGDLCEPFKSSRQGGGSGRGERFDLAYYIAFFIRGLLVRDECVHESSVSDIMASAAAQNVKFDAKQLELIDEEVTRLINVACAESDRHVVALGEMIPRVEVPLKEGEDPWEAVLGAFTSLGNEYEPAALRAALADAGVSTRWDNLVSGRLTKTMATLGFEKVVDSLGRRYVRSGVRVQP